MTPAEIRSRIEQWDRAAVGCRPGGFLQRMYEARANEYRVMLARVERHERREAESGQKGGMKRD